MENRGEFERMALKLVALNFAFESARSGSPDEEVLRMSEKTGEVFGSGEETESSDSF